MDIGGIEAARLNTCIGKSSSQAFADNIQRLFGRLPASGRRIADAPIDDHAHTPRLPAPGQASDRVVIEQTALLCNSTQVMGKEAKIEGRKLAFSRTWLKVIFQGGEIAVPVGIILGIKLNDPGRFIQFIKTVLERVLQCIPDLCQPGGFPAFRADRHQLEERGDGNAVLQQHALRFRQIFHPGQKIRKRR
ncbi:Uncharacterised protein [Serratia ficaria]|nr:Uncharacterised protein [Serratia ficaria]